MKKNIIFITVFAFASIVIGCKNPVNHNTTNTEAIKSQAQDIQPTVTESSEDTMPAPVIVAPSSAPKAMQKDATKSAETESNENRRTIDWTDTKGADWSGTSKSKIGTDDKEVTLGFISDDEVSVRNGTEGYPQAKYSITDNKVTITLDDKPYTLTLSNDKQTLTGSLEEGFEVTLNRD